MRFNGRETTAPYEPLRPSRASAWAAPGPLFPQPFIGASNKSCAKGGDLLP